LELEYHWRYALAARRFLIALLGGVSLSAVPNPALLAQPVLGVRPELRASASLEPNSPYAAIAKNGRVAADLHVVIRISDHAPEADFYGVVVADYTELTVGQSGSEQLIWQAKRCHQNRGLPKVSAIDIRGTIADGDTIKAISAVPRHIGKLVPEDEIVATKQISHALDSSVTELTMRAETKTSRIVLEFRLIALRC